MQESRISRGVAWIWGTIPRSYCTAGMVVPHPRQDPPRLQPLCPIWMRGILELPKEPGNHERDLLADVHGVVDVGGGSTEVILGTVPGGASQVLSWRVGSGVLADELISSDPPSAAEIRKVRDRIDDIFAGVAIEHPAQAVAVGGSATSLRRLGGAVLEYETLERGIRVLCGDPAAEVARRYELDPERVRILATGVLLLEKVSELLGQPLQIGKGGLREGVVLDMLNGSINGSRIRLAA